MVPIYQKSRFLYRAFPAAGKNFFYPARGDGLAKLSRGFAGWQWIKGNALPLDNVDIREYIKNKNVDIRE